MYTVYKHKNVHVDKYICTISQLTKTLPSQTRLKPSSNALNGSSTDSSRTYLTYARTYSVRLSNVTDIVEPLGMSGTVTTSPKLLLVN